VVAELDEASLPLVRLPGGAKLHRPSAGQVSRALGIGLELGTREEVDLLVVGAGPAGLGAAVYGASEGLETLVVDAIGLGGQAGASRRIENYLGFPAGITGSELTSRASAAEVGHDRPERDVDDCRVERDHQEPETDGRQTESLAAVLGGGERGSVSGLDGGGAHTCRVLSRGSELHDLFTHAERRRLPHGLGDAELT
jgi:thioredoxin reductase (NADPH)